MEHFQDPGSRVLGAGQQLGSCRYLVGVASHFVHGSSGRTYSLATRESRICATLKSFWLDWEAWAASPLSF